MSTEIKITHELMKALWPENSDWSDFVTRADGLKMGRDGARQNSRLGSLPASYGFTNHCADTYEGKWLTDWVGSGAYRVLPEEEQMVPFFAKLTQAVDATKADWDVGAPEGRSHRSNWIDYTSIPAELEYHGVNLRKLARRMAITRPGKDDGESMRVYYRELYTVLPAHTPQEASAMREIERLYFSPRFGLSWENKALSATILDDREKGLKVDLKGNASVTQKKQDSRGLTFNVQQSITELDVEAPPGSVVFVTGSQVETKSTFDEYGKSVSGYYVGLRSGANARPFEQATVGADGRVRIPIRQASVMKPLGIIIVKPTRDGPPEILARQVVGLTSRSQQITSHSVLAPR